MSATSKEPSELIARLDGEEKFADVPWPSAKPEDPRNPAKVEEVYCIG